MLLTGEFRHSFEAETDRMLRRRVLWFASIWLTVRLFVMAMGLGGGAWSNLALGQGIALITIFVGWAGLYIWSIVTMLRDAPEHRQVMRLSMALIIADGLIAVAFKMLGVSGLGIWSFLFSHFVACCIFPWRVRQALIPPAVVLPVGILAAVLIDGATFLETLFLVFGAGLLLVPAVTVAHFRYSQRLQRSSGRFFQQRYGMLRQELAYARQVHEALFPDPVDDGPIGFRYRYEPMRQIGGDYLHAQWARGGANDGCFNVVIVDVTGHGIPAALTVNRLHGELDLRFAERPDISPGEMLEHLNHYVHLTLARHSIYVTALCARVDPRADVIQFASGGHPPAFVRRVDGTIEELDSTAFVLGACADRDFDANERSIDFGPGDSLIAYTDGATEARSPGGDMLRITGLRSAVAGLGGQIGQGVWAERLLDVVARHRGGAPPDDDTLVIEVWRPIAPRQLDSGEAVGVGAAGPS